VYNRENEASLAVLPDLFVELDSMDEVCLCSCVINVSLLLKENMR
jgi:hypothetical protein